MSAIKTLLEEGVRKGHFPGCQYAVVSDKGIVESNAIGYKAIYPNPIPVTGDEVYDCASLTKVVVTTTLIMKLIELDLLALDTTIQSVLPQYIHSQTTIKDLLIHASGLPADIPNAKALRNKQNVQSYIFSVDLSYPPRTKVVYSDIGFILLGWIVEKITGKPLDQYAKEIIFAPLGMNDSSFHPNRKVAAPTEYRDDDVYEGLLAGRVHDEKAFALGGISGHAGLFSTAQDLSRFIQSILVNDGRVLKPTTVDLLFIPQIEYKDDQKHIIRSIGWDKPTMKSTAGDYVSFDETILHTGFTGCNLWIDRHHQIGFVLLSNAVHPKRSMNKIIPYRHTIGTMILTNGGSEK